MNERDGALQELVKRAAATQDDGLVEPIGRIVASYPTLPFLAVTLLEIVTPAGTPTPGRASGKS